MDTLHLRAVSLEAGKVENGLLDALVSDLLLELLRLRIVMCVVEQRSCDADEEVLDGHAVLDGHECGSDETVVTAEFSNRLATDASDIILDSWVLESAESHKSV
jgi:hypothetical protein